MCMACVQSEFQDYLDSAEGHNKQKAMLSLYRKGPAPDATNAVYLPRSWIKKWVSAAGRANPNAKPSFCSLSTHLACQHGGLQPPVSNYAAVPYQVFEYLRDEGLVSNDPFMVSDP